MMKEVTIWKALLDGECKQIANSEHFLWQELETNAWFEPEERDRWETTSETRRVPVATGDWVLADRWHVDLDASVPEELGPPNTKAPHVLWHCPLCNTDHFTDVERGDDGEALWLCENSNTMDDIVLVQWKTKDANSKRLSVPLLSGH